MEQPLVGITCGKTLEAFETKGCRQTESRRSFAIKPGDIMIFSYTQVEVLLIKIAVASSLCYYLLFFDFTTLLQAACNLVSTVRQRAQRVRESEKSRDRRMCKWNWIKLSRAWVLENFFLFLLSSFFFCDLLLPFSEQSRSDFDKRIMMSWKRSAPAISVLSINSTIVVRKVSIGIPNHGCCWFVSWVSSQLSYQKCEAHKAFSDSPRKKVKVSTLKKESGTARKNLKTVRMIIWCIVVRPTVCLFGVFFSSLRLQKASGEKGFDTTIRW